MSSWHLPAEVSKSGSEVLGSAPGNQPGVHRPQRQLVLVHLKQMRSFPRVIQQEARWEIELWHEWNTRSPSPPAYADLGLAEPICIFIKTSMRETGLRPAFPCPTALRGNSICHGDQLHLLFIYINNMFNDLRSSQLVTEGTRTGRNRCERVHMQSKI